MKPLRILLTNEQRIELKKKISSDLYPWQVAKRLEAIRLLDTELSVRTIAKQLCVNREIVYQYIKTFKQKGIEGLLTLDKPGRESKLTEEQIDCLEAYIEECKNEGIKCKSKEQSAWIKQMYGVDIGEKWVYKMLLLRRQAHLTSPHLTSPHLDQAMLFSTRITFLG